MNSVLRSLWWFESYIDLDISFKLYWRNLHLQPSDYFYFQENQKFLIYLRKIKLFSSAHRTKSMKLPFPSRDIFVLMKSKMYKTSINPHLVFGIKAFYFYRLEKGNLSRWHLNLILTNSGGLCQQPKYSEKLASVWYSISIPRQDKIQRFMPFQQTMTLFLKFLSYKYQPILIQPISNRKQRTMSLHRSTV